MQTLYWEDFEVGERSVFGAESVSRDDLLDFARRYDPQPMHTDEQAASEGWHGGLIASGWHTAALCMRMMVRHVLNRSSSMGSPGVEYVRWLAPVRPGDTLHLRMETLSRRVHPRRPELGFVTNHFEVLNQHNEVVMGMRSGGMFLLREPAAEATSGGDS